MKEETGIKIDTEELLTILECTICYTQYTEPTMTKCGHTYCKACVEACINRNHECPDCKTPLTLSDITRNIQVERMQRQIKDLQEKAKKDPLGSVDNGVAGYVMSPVVGIFQENFRNCMGQFENYCEKLRERLEDTKRKIKEKYKGMETAEEEKEIAEVEKQYKKVVDTLIKEYDRHMREGVTEPVIRNIKVVVQMPSKNIRIENVNLRPYDSMKEVKSLLERQLEMQKNPVLKWGSNIRYIVLNPYSNGPPAEESKSAVEVLDDMEPVYKLNILSGSRIIVEGVILCESDSAKPCITLHFRAEEGKAYNYYSCDTCTLNWICEPCVQHCHKGHKIKEYLKGHVPNWACCYCWKKGCKLPNKNNPNLPASIMFD